MYVVKEASEMDQKRKDDLYAGIDDDSPVDYIGEHQEALEAERLKKDIEELKKRVQDLEEWRNKFVISSKPFGY